MFRQSLNVFLPILILAATLSCVEDQKTSSRNRPSDSGEDFPGFLDSTERDITVESGGVVRSGNTTVTFAPNSAAKDFRVRLRRMEKTPTLTDSEVAVLGDAKGDIVQVEVFDAETDLILSSDQLLTPYEFQQTIVVSNTTENLGLIVVTEPGEATEQHILLPNSELTFAEDSLNLITARPVSVSIKLTVTYAQMALFDYSPDALGTFTVAAADTIIISGGTKTKSAAEISAESNGSGATTESTEESGTEESSSTSPSIDRQLIGAGKGHTCAIAADGGLWCWGDNDAGELGNGTSGSTPTLLPNTTGSGNQWHTLGIGSENNCALKTDHTLWCWGNNTDSVLGNGTIDQKNEPTKIGSDTDWMSLRPLPVTIMCATKTDDSLWCWGNSSIDRNSGGQSTNFPTPTKLDWRDIGVGAFHNCIIKTDGSLWCWGANDYGQLGTSNYVESQTKVRVGSDFDWASIKTFASTNCALKSDHSLWCWGLNTNGEVGDASTTNRSSPHKVSGSNDWSSFDMHYGRMCAIKTDSTLWCWGANTMSALGNATAENPQKSPIQITSATDWKSVSVGLQHICAKKTDETFWCWGLNYVGQLGTGDNLPQTTPFQVTGF